MKYILTHKQKDYTSEVSVYIEKDGTIIFKGLGWNEDWWTYLYPDQAAKLRNILEA